MKKRLIDAREGKKVFCAIAQPAEYKGAIHMVVPISEIDKLPTVDAVEVVRCKDCKYLYDEMDDYCCMSHRGLARICENSYCSYGERRTDG